MFAQGTITAPVRELGSAQGSLYLLLWSMPGSEFVVVVDARLCSCCYGLLQALNLLWLMPGFEPAAVVCCRLPNMLVWSTPGSELIVVVDARL